MLGKLLLNPWVLLGIAVALVISHGWVFVKATNIANDHWAAKIAVETEKVRAAMAANNRKTEEELRVLVDVQTKARLEAEALTEEFRNELAADKTDTVVHVGPELDRLFCRAVGRGGQAGPAPIQASDNRKCPDLPPAAKQIRPAPGSWDLKVAIGRINTLELLYGRCADLQARNLTQLRGDRR